VPPVEEHDVVFDAGGEVTFVVFDADGGDGGGGNVQLSSVSPFPVPGIKEPILVLPLLHPWQDQLEVSKDANRFVSHVHVVEVPPSPIELTGQDLHALPSQYSPREVVGLFPVMQVGASKVQMFPELSPAASFVPSLEEAMLYQSLLLTSEVSSVQMAPESVEVQMFVP